MLQKKRREKKKMGECKVRRKVRHIWGLMNDNGSTHPEYVQGAMPM